MEANGTPADHDVIECIRAEDDPVIADHLPLQQGAVFFLVVTPHHPLSASRACR